MIQIRLIGTFLIIFVTIVSYLIANQDQGFDTGLYGVAQIFIPILSGIISTIVFLVLTFIIKKKAPLYVVLILLIGLILYLGFDLVLTF